MGEQIKKIKLPDGLQIGIKNLDNILSEVAQLNLIDSQILKQILLEKVGDNSNYVPPSAKDEYATSLLREYLKKYGETEEIRDRNKDRVESHKHTPG
ncbi:MAG: hypothetical protein HN929_02425 [Chloroflexi bacterium]|jgi:hypothetical protein|nr:hypothetical protein [Chloroflexota bacterium]MBT7080316.1 hypothetical protein [Chloroflexota bacterium]